MMLLLVLLQFLLKLIQIIQVSVEVGQREAAFLASRGRISTATPVFVAVIIAIVVIIIAVTVSLRCIVIRAARR